MAEIEYSVNTKSVINSNRETAQDKFSFYNTLTGLVKGLEGQYTTIDLRNECCITGKIIRVDGQMNLDMRDVIFYDSRGSERIFPNFFLNKRNIRNVHIPKGTSSLELIEKQLTAMKTPINLTKTKRTFKSIRAERYNKETVQSAFGDKLST